MKMKGDDMAANDNTPTYQDALDHEGSSIAAGVQKYIDAAKKGDVSSIGGVHKWSLEKVARTEDTLKKIIAEAKAKTSSTTEWVPRVEKLNLYAVSYTAFMCCLDGADKQWTMNELRFNIGRAIACLAFESALSETREGRRLMERLTRSADLVADKFEPRAKFVERMAAKRGFSWDDWSKDEEKLCAKVGAGVLTAVQRANRDIFVPEKSHQNPDDKWEVPFLQLTPEAENDLENILGDEAASSPMFSPMNTRPNDWGPHNVGPYMTTSLARMTPMIKREAPEQKAWREQAMAEGRFDDALEALNTLQRVPYTINQYVVDAVDWVRKTGKSRLVNSFPHTRECEVPKLDEGVDPNSLPKMERQTYFRERKQAKAHNRQARANRTKLRRTIQMARNLAKDWPCFYLPHNWDRRGRIYHVCDFGHHNTDHMRAMFMMANKTEMNTSNEHFVMLQLANSYGNGIDKKSFAERIDWVADNLSSIRAAGEDFKKNFDFWREAGDPFQFLAACHEWAEYKKHGDGFLSGLPIALDATQSGIQHFAAASLNFHDGELVNLVDQEKPNDLYMACLEEAKRLLDIDLAEKEEEQRANPVNDNDRKALADHEKTLDQLSKELTELPLVPVDDKSPNAKRERERLKTDREDLEKRRRDETRRFERTRAAEKFKLERKIVAAKQWKKLGLERKHIKRNCLTWAYSSKEFGFAKQLQSDFMDELATQVRLGDLEEHPFQPDNGHTAAFYLADINEKAIESVVQSAKRGMDFFQTIASILGNDRGLDGQGKGKHLQFVTPRIGFPMYQYYRPQKSGTQKVYLYKHEMDLIETRENMSYKKYLDGINMDKSKSGASPNIIHAMDSTHLMMTTLRCKDKGVDDLMVVHDSFSSTVGNCHNMRESIKEAFIELYTDYCLYTDLLEQAKARHSDPESVDWPEIPPKGDQNGKLLEIADIIYAKYPFS